MSQQRRLCFVLAINLAMITSLVIVGLGAHSLGVLAAGGDYAADSVAILLGIIAIQIAKQPHGNPKATTYVALINATALVVLTAVVIYTGLHRLLHHSPAVSGLPVVIVSLVAAAAMGLGAFVLGSGSCSGNSDLHMRSVLLDTVSDAVSSMAVAIAGAIILVFGKYYWLDPLLAVLIGLIIGFNALGLLRDVVRALRSKKPLASDSF
jgi:cobalt-zinc-cadmium efflux system protein